ncbi:MAG: diguanylate cyclase, partial [Pseudomonadota bacterium]
APPAETPAVEPVIPRPPKKAERRPLMSVASESFRTTFLIFYALSSLLPLLILIFIYMQYIQPQLPTDLAVGLRTPITYGLAAVLAVPFLGSFLMSWWVKSLENLTREIKTKTAEVLQNKIVVTEKNEIVALGQHLDGLYEELQHKIQQLNEYSQKLVDSKKKLSDLSITDESTNLYNRNFFQSRLMEEMSRSDKYKRDLSLIMIEAFPAQKMKPEERPAGDQMLRPLALMIKDYIRKSDIPFRYGEYELAILVPEASAEEAAAMANKIVEVAGRLTFPDPNDGTPTRISISCGVAPYTLGRADFILDVGRALQMASSAGKDRVVIIPPKAPGK